MENLWGGVRNEGQLYTLFNLSTRRSGVWKSSRSTSILEGLQDFLKPVQKKKKVKPSLFLVQSHEGPKKKIGHKIFT